MLWLVFMKFTVNKCVPLCDSNSQTFQEYLQESFHIFVALESSSGWLNWYWGTRGIEFRVLPSHIDDLRSILSASSIGTNGSDPEHRARRRVGLLLGVAHSLINNKLSSEEILSKYLYPHKKYLVLFCLLFINHPKLWNPRRSLSVGSCSFSWNIWVLCVHGISSGCMSTMGTAGQPLSISNDCRVCGGAQGS